MNKILLTLLLLISTFSIFGESNKRALAEELLELQNSQSTLDAIYDQMGKMSQGMYQQLKVKPSENERFEKYTTKLFSLLKEEMSWEKMKDPMIDVYVKYYTVTELQDMVTFYKSETGKSMVSKMPLMMKDTMAITQAMLKDFLPKMQAITKEMKEELAASRNSDK